MVNIWNAYQCMVTFNMSRSASLFESGIGRGMGFRDSNQDLLGFVHMVPARARERILDIAATQLPTRRRLPPVPAADQARQQRRRLRASTTIRPGSSWPSPPTSRRPATPRSSTSRSPYDNEPGSETPLYEHLQRAIGYTLERLGPHGLPLIGRADWNDCLNLNCFSETPGESFQTTENKEGGVAESVFIGGLFVLAAGRAGRHRRPARRRRRGEPSERGRASP